MSWFERRLDGHVSFLGVTIFGFNAMHVAVNIRTRWGFICFHPTMRVFGKWWPWYFYISQDGTPCRARFGIGPGMRD